MAKPCPSDLDPERDASLLLAAIVESSEDAIYSYGTDGVLRTWNGGAERLYGYTAEDAVGRPFTLLVDAAGEAELHDLLRRVLAGERVVGSEARRRRSDGASIVVAVTMSPVRDCRGDVVGVSAIARDLSDVERARRGLEERVAERTAQLEVRNRALERSNAELEQYAYVASHDLQEPLRAIIGFAELLNRRQGEAALDEHSARFVEHVVDGARRMRRLIDDLLAYARVGAGSQGMGATDMEAVLADVLADTAACVEEAGAVVTHDPLPVVEGDATQLRQLAQNLVSNAVKFRGDAAPRVHVAAELRGDDGTYWFSVTDNGIGIHPEQAQRVFELFGRLHTRAAYPGTGIGLAICRKVVEAHGGRIWVESMPGRGATFWFTLSPARSPR